MIKSTKLRGLGRYAFLLALSSFAFAQANAKDGDSFSFSHGGITLNYRVISEKDKSVAVVKNQPANVAKLTVPVTVSNNDVTYNVMAIGDSAFMNWQSITELNLSDSIKSIGDYAFSNCKGLSNVVLPDSVKSFGKYAFSYCDGITKFQMPVSLKTMGMHAFQECTGLTSVILPKNVTSVGSYPFGGCVNLKRSAYPSTIRNPYSNGVAVEYPASGAYLKNGYVMNADSTVLYFAPVDLSGVYAIPSHIKTIEESAFACCDNLTGITFPSSVVAIKARAFADCNGFTTFTYPQTVTTIPDYAFSGCSNLANVVIPSTVTSIGANAFENCSALSNVNIPNSVVSIGEYAFVNCANIAAIDFPTSLKTIGVGAFQNCYGFKTIILPNSLTFVAQDAFKNCIGLVKSAYPSTVANPFANGMALAYPAQGAEVQNGFVWNSGKTALYFAPLSLQGEYNVPNTVATIGDYAFALCSGLTGVKMNNSVTYLGEHAFANCTGITKAELSNSLAAVSAYAFEGCTALNDATIPGSVTTIGKYAFLNCSALTDLDLPASVTTISEGAYQGCAGFTNIMLGKTVASVGKDAFKNCSGLLKSSYPATLQNPFSNGGAVAYPMDATFADGFIWSADNSIIYYAPMDLTGEYVIPNTVVSIGDYAFSYCPDMTGVVIPNTVTTIGKSAFEACSFSDLLLPPSVETVADKAFGDTPLTNITMGAKVKKIGNAAFGKTETPVENVYVTAMTPPNGVKQSFANYSAQLYVMPDMAEVYSFYNPWSGFKKAKELVVPDSLNVSFEKPEGGLKAGDKVQLTYKFKPSNVTLQYVFWSSTNPEVATVDRDGMVTFNGYNSANADDVKECKIIATTLYPDCNVEEITLHKDGNISGVEGILAEDLAKVQVSDIYSLQGALLKRNASPADIEALSPGLYIIGGKKVLVK